MSTFKNLGLHSSYVKSLKELGIKSPTDIQTQAIPLLLNANTDLVGLAQTGTGKTAAFGLPLLHKINPELNAVQALILAPTRELVQQIKKQLFKFTKYNSSKIFVEGVYGGEKIEIQLKNLARPTHIIVATPGRLVDLINREAISLKSIQTVVFDEADEMLSMGFKNDLTTILSSTPKNKQTWLFSATMPQDLKVIVERYIKPNAKRLQIDKSNILNTNISHYYVQTSLKAKVDTLVALLEQRSEERGIIFCRTKAGTQSLTQELQNEGFNVAALEGDMQQRDRDKVMRAFKNKSLQYLVSTDVSARGIDVSDLGFVIHYQLPEHLEYFTHRSGRTARAGKKGASIAIVLDNEQAKLTEIKSKLGINMTLIKV
jgi:ATP-dependent RNA helicase DeaD